MSTKSKIITVIVCIFVELGLLAGAWAIGKNSRYKGTTDIGTEVVNNITDGKTDVEGANTNVGISINLLDPTISANTLNIQIMESLKENNEKKDLVIEKFINRFNTTEKSLEDFEKTYKGSNEDYAWDLVIKEAEELEQLREDYRNLIAAYNTEKSEE
jgi:hypothetical protein